MSLQRVTCSGFFQIAFLVIQTFAYKEDLQILLVFGQNQSA